MVIHLFNCQFGCGYEWLFTYLIVSLCGYEWLFTYLIVSLCVGMNGYSLHFPLFQMFQLRENYCVCIDKPLSVLIITELVVMKSVN